MQFPTCLLSPAVCCVSTMSRSGITRLAQIPSWLSALHLVPLCTNSWVTPVSSVRRILVKVELELLSFRFIRRCAALTCLPGHGDTAPCTWCAAPRGGGALSVRDEAGRGTAPSYRDPRGIPRMTCRKLLLLTQHDIMQLLCNSAPGVSLPRVPRR